MQSHPERDDEPPPDRGLRGLLVPIIIVAVLVVVVLLHLTGVIGAGSH